MRFTTVACTLVLGGLVACGTESATPPDDVGGGATTSTTSGSGGTGGAGGSTASTGGAGVGGEGGVGGAPLVWPTCDAKPDEVPAKTLNEIWLDDPTEPTEVWVAGVYVTAVSAGGCTAGAGCQIFVQQQETFADITAGSKQALKLFASPATAHHFAGIAVGDRLDLQAHAWRYDVDGQNELLLQVANHLPGCAKVVGTGTPMPVAGLDLVDLTVQLYEYDMGPLLIELTTVSGKPHLPTELFGLWESFMPGNDPLEEVTSMSPYMLAGSAFTGFQPEVIHNFPTVTGIFSLYVPPANPPQKYEVIYPRTMDDAPFGGQ